MRCDSPLGLPLVVFRAGKNGLPWPQSLERGKEKKDWGGEARGDKVLLRWGDGGQLSQGDCLRSQQTHTNELAELKQRGVVNETKHILSAKWMFCRLPLFRQIRNDTRRPVCISSSCVIPVLFSTTDEKKRKSEDYVAEFLIQNGSLP